MLIGRPGPSAASVTAVVVGACGAALVLGGCNQEPVASDPTDPPTTTSASPSTPARTPAHTRSPATPSPAAGARVLPVLPAQWQAMAAAGMVRAECPVTSRSQLRVVEVGYHGFDSRVHRGRLVVNADVAAGVARIFTRLFDAGFPIRRMRPIEAYGGDDDASMAADNTSAFNCRRPDQSNSDPLASPHANGRAIDINPRENPWQDSRCGLCWQPTARYAARTPGRGKILYGGAVWKAFTDEGWIWQDIPTADYQHFDTGYPSTVPP